MASVEEIIGMLEDEVRIPYLPRFWRTHVLASLAERPHLAHDLSLEKRHAYLAHHILPIMARSDSVFGELCLRLRAVENLDSLVAEFELPFPDSAMSGHWFDWGLQSIHRDENSVALYCLCNYWSFPSEDHEVDSRDVIAFRMLRFLLARMQGFEVPISFGTRAEDIQRVSEDAAIRSGVQELLAAGSGLGCLANGWKDTILRLVRTQPTTWISEYRSKNLDFIERHIEGYARNPTGDGEREFAQLCQRLRPGNGLDGLASAKELKTSNDAATWIHAARIAVINNNPAEGLWCAAAFIAAPELRPVTDRDSADAIRIMRKCIRLIRSKS